MPWKMPLKERLVDRDVLQADDPLLLLDLENPVHQQERVAVGQNLHDVFYRIHPLLLSSGFNQLTYQRNRSTMTWLHGNDTRANPRACERKVTHAVHRLMTHELVLPAQIAAQDDGIVEHHCVLEGSAFDKSLGPQSVHLMNKP